MKPLTFAKSLLSISLLIFLFSCQKNTAAPDSPPPPPLPITDTGINYFTPATCNFNMNETVLTSAGWTKVFEDNFNTDLSQWNVFTGGNGSKELSYYSAANVVLQSGILEIRAKKESVTDPTNQTQKVYPYTSGFIESKATFSADLNTPKVRVTARIKLPNGSGMLSYFLSKGDNWPTQGEIDVIIASGNLPFFYANKYYYGNDPSYNLVANSNGFITANSDLTNCFHVYEMEWTKNALTYYIDGNLIERKTTGGHIPDLFGKKQRLQFYLTVLSDLINIPQIQPGTFYIDWVKVYTSS